MRSDEELLELAEKLRKGAEAPANVRFDQPIAALKEAVDKVIRSFSGSWLGYHANIYYADLNPPPPGAHFSQEWGLKELFGDMGSRGAWREFDPNVVEQYVYQLAGNPDLSDSRQIAGEAVEQFEKSKAEALSILSQELAEKSDSFLGRLQEELENLRAFTPQSVIEYLKPKGQIISRDAIAVSQGFRTPPHVRPLAEVLSLRHNAGLNKAAADILAKAGAHLERSYRRSTAAGRIGTNVFIGHGRSGSWRELKDFIQDRARLPWDEFNRVPVAGVTNIERLLQMLDAAAIALLVMTAEDEMVDGAVQARMNVIHEAGLFQGRLGFSKAILLLEEGCAEFSNVQGLGQIRFPKGNIGAAFEEVRRVLEREGLLNVATS